ncbi:MAG TPA: EboA domain-containing protein [Candidatus Limnocylindrales bacterium]|nr:EboA domain-containing protein [Candidatus Limnocylindrales bacterium]
MTTLNDFRDALHGQGLLADEGWLAGAIAAVAADSAALPRLFPAAGRRCGRQDLPQLPGWSVDEAARAMLLAAVPAGQLAVALDITYHDGDAAEKLAVLKTLPWLPIGDAALPLVWDALRTNDTRLVAAALGPYATHLDDAAWRQAVLKCVFMGVPLSNVYGLTERADGELAAMLDSFARERRAAGRPVPADALTLLDQSRGAAKEA